MMNINDIIALVRPYQFCHKIAKPDCTCNTGKTCAADFDEIALKMINNGYLERGV